MKRSIPLAVFLAALIGVVSIPHAEASCSVVGDPKNPARITADGATMDVPPSRDIRNCSGISVLKGVAVLIYEAGTGDMKSLECGVGAPCSAPDGAKSTAKGASTTGFIDKLRLLLAGAPEARAGGRRYDQDAQRLAGLPRGKIYSAERAGDFDFGASGIGTWTIVVTREPGRTPIFQRSGNDPILRLPSGLLLRGGKYGWMVTAGDKRFTGGFDILAPGPAAEVERDLREAGVPDRPLTRKQQVDALLVLFEHDLDHEVRLLSRELGL